jgi:K+-transporting ATPase ATPase B chain
MGVIELQDIIKPGIAERFDRLRKMGVKTVMVTGDNPLTAKFIAEKAVWMILLPRQSPRIK